MVRTNRVKRQILRMDGNNCFMEVLNDRFFEEKVHFVFANYDKTKESGEKIGDNKIDFFLTFGDALVFCENIIKDVYTQKLSKDRKAYRNALIEAQKSGNKCQYFYGNPYWCVSRGTQASQLAVKRADGKSESRKMMLLPGYVPPNRMLNPASAEFKNKRKPNRFVIQCESGPGDKVESSVAGGFIIKPAYTKPEKKVMIPITEPDMGLNYKDDLLEFAKVLKANIEGYIQASYTYEFVNPAPGIISASAIHQNIKVGDVVDIVIYTPSNITRIDSFIKGKPIQPDEEMKAIPTETNTLEWHFKKRANKAQTVVFEFLPYVNYEKGEYTKRCLVVVGDPNKK